MSTSQKKPLLFGVIVVVGTVLVLLDVPLPWLVPLLILVGLVTLLALGSLTWDEIRAALPGGRPASPGTGGTTRPAGTVPKKTGDMKTATPPGADTEGAIKPAGNGGGTMPAPATRLSTLVSSVRSLGSLYRDTGSREKKVEDIDRLLDKTVSERVTAPPRAGTVKAGGKIPGPGDGSGAALAEGTDREDGPAASPPLPGAPASDAGGNPASAAGGPDLPPVPGRTAARENSVDGGGDPGLFSGRDGLGADAGVADTRCPGSPERDGIQATPETMAGPAAGGSTDRPAVKTIRGPADAPDGTGGSGDGVPADTAGAARGAGGDEALFRTIALDGTDVRKAQDTSLLRDLKDFRAPAAEIERELEDLSGQLGVARQKPKKNPPANQEKN